MRKRKSAFWMKQLDERILEHLSREGWATPSMIAREDRITCSEGHVRERCEKLREVEFIDTFHSEMYELTTDGILYLKGKIDARNRPWPREDRMLRNSRLRSCE